MTTPPGIVVPTSATGTFCPAATLGAPHTMFSTSSCPASTVHTAQMIRIGMGLFRQDVPDDDVLDGIIRMDDVFQLQPKHRQAIADFLSPGFHRNKFAQPFQT